MFTSVSHLFDLVFISFEYFGARDAPLGSPSQLVVSCCGSCYLHSISICCASLVLQPVHTDNLYNQYGGLISCMHTLSGAHFLSQVFLGFIAWCHSMVISSERVHPISAKTVLISAKSKRIVTLLSKD